MDIFWETQRGKKQNIFSYFIDCLLYDGVDVVAY